MPWDMRKTIRERMDRVGASLTAKLRDHHDPRLAFEHRVDTWFVVLGLHRVALPIADAFSPVNDLRTRLDRIPWLEVTLISSHTMRSPSFLFVSQVWSQILTPLLWVSIFDLCIYELIYGFRRNQADAVLFHAPADLLRRPAHLQVLDNVHTDCLVLETPSATSVLSLLERPVMCPSWRVPARLHGIVPTDLPRD